MVHGMHIKQHIQKPFLLCFGAISSKRFLIISPALWMHWLFLSNFGHLPLFGAPMGFVESLCKGRCFGETLSLPFYVLCTHCRNLHLLEHGLMQGQWVWSGSSWHHGHGSNLAFYSGKTTSTLYTLHVRSLEPFFFFLNLFFIFYFLVGDVIFLNQCIWDWIYDVIDHITCTIRCCLFGR